MNTAVLHSSHRVMAEKARTFHWAAHLLPASARDDAAVVYALCRLVDDLADDGRDTRVAESRLLDLRAELEGRRPPRPLVAEFLGMARRVDLPIASALELIEGVRSDLGAVRIQTTSELIQYCYRVASTVGLMMCAVLRVRDPDARPHAVDLGIAMQLTNIARDVAEDAARDRVYLPRDLLAGSGLTPDEVVSGRADRRALSRVVAQLLEIADTYYHSADTGMRAIPARFRFAILVASRVYRAIGVRLIRCGGDPFRGRTVVPMWERLFWASRALAAGARPGMLGLGPKAPHRVDLHRPLVGRPGTNPRA